MPRTQTGCCSISAQLKQRIEDQARILQGPMLHFDDSTERFTGEGAEAGNPLLTREYRAPFVVPNAV